MTGKGLKSIGDQAAEQYHINKLNFNHERQNYFEGWSVRIPNKPGLTEEERYKIQLDAVEMRMNELSHIVKRTVSYWNSSDRDLAIREAAVREGWTYWTPSESGMEARNCAKRMENWHLTWERIREANRRDKWIWKYKAQDIDLFPMDFENEEAYAAAVEKIKEKEKKIKEEEHPELYGYNIERHNELYRILMPYQICADSEMKKDRYQSDELKEISKIIKRRIDFEKMDAYDWNEIICEVAFREGWKVKSKYYPHEFSRAKRNVEEADRRDDWVNRCEHAKDVYLFPMDCADEETYQAVVELEYAKMQKRIKAGKDPHKISYDMNRQNELEEIKKRYRYIVIPDSDSIELIKILGRRIK